MPLDSRLALPAPETALNDRKGSDFSARQGRTVKVPRTDPENGTLGAVVSQGNVRRRRGAGGILEHAGRCSQAARTPNRKRGLFALHPGNWSLSATSSLRGEEAPSLPPF